MFDGFRNNDWNEYTGDVLRYLSPVALFWGANQVGQRLGGALKLYYGRRGSNLAGLAIVSASSMAAQTIKTKYIDSYIYKRKLRPITRNEFFHRTYLSLFCFLSLGLRPFNIVLPSSVITLGSFAKTQYIPFYGQIGSVNVASETASATQRVQIQKLGRLYGCHHCGNKQLFSMENFIADHMPPTAHVKKANQRLWRRITGFQMKQALFPQCQKCFQKQGSAVRMGIHELIYNYKLRPQHFALLMAYALSDFELSQQLTRPFVFETHRLVDILEYQLDKILK